MVNQTCPSASHGTGNMSIASVYPFSNVYKVLSCKVKQRGQKVQVGIDQEKAQSERDSHSKSRGGKN